MSALLGRRPMSRLLLLVGGLVLTGSGRAEPDGVRMPRDVASLWAANCAYCHEGGVAPVLAGRQLPAALVTEIVRSGTLRMPAFRPTDLSPDELAALGRWIHQLPPGATGASR